MRILKASVLPLCLAMAACDPSYCAEVHGTVRTAAGQPAPDSTKVLFYMGPPPTDSADYAPVVDSAFTASGAYKQKFRFFLIDLSAIGIRTLGRDTVARIHSSTRCSDPPRTRVDIVGA